MRVMSRKPESEQFQMARVGVLSRLREDIAAALKNDPAARSRLEVILCYPGLHALWMHRIAFALSWRGFHLTARLISQINRFLTGIEIHPGARIGRRVFIDHGMGIVIGETSVIEDDVLIYKGVLLGGTTLDRTIRHPWIKRGAILGSNACILGAIIVGENAKIGSGSVVIRDVPNNATVVGVPGRAVHRDKSAHPLEHSDLPDPVARAVTALMRRLEESDHRIAKLEENCHMTDTTPHEPALPSELEELEEVFGEGEEYEYGSGI